MKTDSGLQQLLPFTVLKPIRKQEEFITFLLCVATALTVYGIETVFLLLMKQLNMLSCNSSYRLRY